MASTRYDDTAQAVLRGIGGEGNVKSVTHCATRLRFQLKDHSKADKDVVEGVNGVITVVEAGGQFQVVIGNSVGRVYESIVSNTRVAAGEGGSGGGPVSRVIDLVTSIFSPILWVLAATGLLKALLAVVVKVDPDFATSGTYAILFTAADATFSFLPVFLAVTAARRFKANQFVSIAIAAALVYSATIAVIPGPEGATLTLQAFDTSGGGLTFLGIPVVMISYLSSVLPILLAVYAQSHLERGLNRAIPETLRNFTTPLLTVAIIVTLTFLVIGPVSDVVGTGLSDSVNWLWNLSPAVGGFVMGGLWTIAVVFGVHWGFVPVLIQDLSTQGYSEFYGPIYPAVLAQAGAGLAVFVKTRNKELKEVAGPATVAAFLSGIIEPIMYGVTLRLRKPFVYACIGGAVGGAIVAAGGVAADSFVLPGGLTIPAALNVGSSALLFVGIAAAVVTAFLLTLLLGFKDLPPSKHAAGAETVEDEGVVASEAVALAAPVAGQVVPLAAVPDKVFASGVMGNGLAVIPSEGRVHAPVAGTMVTVMPHAYGIKADNGPEVLVHVGLDTVHLKGQHFTPRVTQGQRVGLGDLLAEFDVEALVAAGYNPLTVVVVTNSKSYSAVVPVADGLVSLNEVVLDVVA